jgi:hypothetical protein
MNYGSHSNSIQSRSVITKNKLYIKTTSNTTWNTTNNIAWHSKNTENLKNFTNS